ncbi:MAG: pentapeptide repeat-containing protein [Planctomycetota bacterium]|jgi:hypothetical protein
MPDDTAKIDNLIEALDEAVSTTENLDFTASKDVSPKPATFKVTSLSFGSVSEREKIRPASVLQIAEGVAQLQVKDNVVKGFEISLNIFFEKNRQGEVLYKCNGEVVASKKVSGGYSLGISMTSIDKTLIPAHRRLLESTANNDFSNWNRWYSDLKEGVELSKINLSDMNLKYFDFCKADLKGSNLVNSDLSYANLSGADLSGCALDNVNFTGADMFRVKIPRKYMGLLTSSGLIEIESVKLVD